MKIPALWTPVPLKMAQQSAVVASALSVWIDLTPDGLDEKVVQRKDGTAVYIT